MGVPGIKNYGRKAYSSGNSIINQFLCKLNFTFEEMYGARIEILLPFIKPEIDRKTFTLGNKGRGYEDIADRLVPKGSTILITGSFGFLALLTFVWVKITAFSTLATV